MFVSLNVIEHNLLGQRLGQTIGYLDLILFLFGTFFPSKVTKKLKDNNNKNQNQPKMFVQRNKMIGIDNFSFCQNGISRKRRQRGFSSTRVVQVQGTRQYKGTTGRNRSNRLKRYVVCNFYRFMGMTEASFNIGT